MGTVLKGVIQAHVEETVEASHSNGPAGHKCRGENDEGHGHSWRIEVEWVYGIADLNEYGWGPDFGKVKAIVRTLDHRNLNRMFSFPPSAENIAIYLYNEILARWANVMRNLTIVIHEGGGNLIVYTEEEV